MRLVLTPLIALPLASCSLLVDAELDEKARSGRDAAVSDAAAQDPVAEPDARADDGSASPDGAGSEPDAAGANAVARIAIGQTHACLLTTRGSVTCWGSSTDGDTDVPAGTYRALAVGDYHTCVVEEGGALLCVGRNNRGQRTPIAGSFVDVATGSAHTCALATSGVAYCEGEDVEGQASPPSDVKFEMLSAGFATTCGIVRDSHALLCWGRGSRDFNQKTLGLAFASLVVGADSICGTEVGGGPLRCWGSLVAPPDLIDLRSVAIYEQGCAVLADGSLQCWGGNSDEPDRMLKGEFTVVGVGTTTTCAARVDGELVCTSTGTPVSMPPSQY